MGNPIRDLPTLHEKCKEVYDIREWEPHLGVLPIAKRVGLNKDTVWRWLKEPEKYDPVYDEIALKRALAGDRAAFDNLTFWETEEFFHRLNTQKRWMNAQEWNDYLAGLGRSLEIETKATIAKKLRSRERAA